QHVDTRPSRIARDNEEAAKLSQWLSEHNPFPKIDVIISIDSGIVGGNEVNCHLSEEIGRDMISKMLGENFENVKFKRKGKVVTLASINSSVKIGNISIVVDPLVFFHRLCIAKKSDDDLKAFFKFELSPFPISLFTGESMRKGTKSSLYTSFSPITEDVKSERSQYVVVDGGHLLHKVVWRQQATFGAIADRYVHYLRNNYGQDIAVIFYGYPDDAPKIVNDFDGQPILLLMKCFMKKQCYNIQKKSSLQMNKAEKDPAPESLLRCISCTSRKGCMNACGCRKAGLHCSLLCKHCIGQSCENPMTVILDNESEEGDAPAPIYMVDEQLECEAIEL
ncbi:hypothetical protein AVEN_108699-1, partial [Araneus ventricosus]